MFACIKCDAQSLKWSGRCVECGKWGTLEEEEGTPSKGSGRAGSGSAGKATKAVAQKSARLSDIKAIAASDRLKTNDTEIDRVFGGGIVPGSITLLSGEPGIGKSTLVAAIASSIGSDKGSVLYVSGEESASQLAGRFERLKKSFDHIFYLDSIPVEEIVATVEKEKPTLVIIDSIQTMRSLDIDALPGSPNNIRYVTSLFIESAKRLNIPVLIIGQVTKDGSVAGPKTLEHLVDVVVNLEGDPVHSFRILRTTKNRFGATDEIGVFEMKETGLIPVPNPSERLLSERANVPGSVITATIEGSRVFLVEIQALVEKTSYGTPVRRASGIDQNRLQMITAILSKRAGLKLGEKDIYINVIGGMSIKEPAADLAISAAIMSAESGIVDPEPTAYMGEVGLGGEVRSIALLERRLQEIQRLGVNKAVVPAKQKIKSTSLQIKSISFVKDLK